MRWKISIAGIGAILILAAIYFFPFGQDMVILWLTDFTGSQVNAWTTMYFVCFGLLFAGLVMGGAKALGAKQLTGIFRLMRTNPVLFFAVLVSLFIGFMAFTGRLPV